jgi:hypothetical protein
VSRRTLRFAKESASRTNPALSASPMSPRHLAAPIPCRSFKQDHNTSRKLLDPLIEPLQIPSLKHRRRGKADYRRHGSPLGISLRLFFTHYNSLASFFVTHGTSSPSSTSHRQSCSPREFIFHPFSSTTKATPRFALIH